MKWVKQDKANREIAYAVKNIIRNSGNKVVKAKGNSPDDKIWNRTKRAKKQSEKTG